MAWKWVIQRRCVLEERLSLCSQFFKGKDNRVVIDRPGHTSPSSTACNELARASQPTIVAISWIRSFVSRDCVDCERSCESLAFRHGWLDTCALAGRPADILPQTRLTCPQAVQGQFEDQCACERCSNVVEQERWINGGAAPDAPLAALGPNSVAVATFRRLSQASRVQLRLFVEESFGDPSTPE